MITYIALFGTSIISRTIGLLKSKMIPESEAIDRLAWALSQFAKMSVSAGSVRPGMTSQLLRAFEVLAIASLLRLYAFRKRLRFSVEFRFTVVDAAAVKASSTRVWSGWLSKILNILGLTGSELLNNNYLLIIEVVFDLHCHPIVSECIDYTLIVFTQSLSLHKGRQSCRLVVQVSHGSFLMNRHP